MSDPTIRTITVKALARVEGEGSLRVRVADGRVEIAEFSIYEPPRFFEKIVQGRAIHEVPDIVARICGICPVAYQMSGCHALEQALGITTTPGIEALRRLLYCGEWIQSHALHIHLLHAPDFLGHDSGISLATVAPELVERGLKLKALGNRIMEVVGGRAVHPINVAVGGFHRAPDPAAIRGLLPELEWGLAAGEEVVREVSRFEFPDFTRAYECVSLRGPRDYPMNHGRVVSSGGLDIDVADYEKHFQERQVPWSTALQSVMLPEEKPYLCGPIARLNLCFDQLPPRARAAFEASGIPLPITNSFQSIVARAVEIVAACEEAIRLVREQADKPITPCRIDFQPREATGCHATEAPRGILYHRYEIGSDGLVTGALIVPPTSQNQGQVEADLKDMLPAVLDDADDAVRHRCEHLIRNYDPCISCATHFLKLEIERVPAG
ncbi:MAG: Ni/Fe hydrogenase subunit alpha [Planctomycetota bacterium]|jgi:sulfhydrogenase subunit alpha|nr:Ni/Fe hydrogenase subunit alpha [Planctomycetota bacterium]MDA1202612.1 Ni/Fe hydrogenase subunit alpha [Planctomycetota bacterium]